MLPLKLEIGGVRLPSDISYKLRNHYLNPNTEKAI